MFNKVIIGKRAHPETGGKTKTFQTKDVNMKCMDLIKIGGYVMIFKEVANRMSKIGEKHRKEQLKENTKNFLLGATIGAAAGAAAGILFAPRSGQESREIIAQRTGETLSNVKDRVSETKENISRRVDEKTTQLRDAAENYSEAMKEATKKTSGEKE